MDTSIHMNAKQGDFAKVVLFPGDPLRAKSIASNFLENVTEVTNVRNMLGYTGTYSGKPVSVMAHGMGTPSISIYANELFSFYDVDKIIRVGTAGGIADDIKVRDIVVAMGAGTNSNMNRSRVAGYDFASIPSFELLKSCWSAVEKSGIKAKFGNVFTNDCFYSENEHLIPALRKMNILAIEMETAELYALAAKYRKHALSILTISDHVITGEETTAQERQETFNDMVKLAIQTAL